MSSTGQAAGGYASLESGHTTASVALQRLVSCTAKNHFYRANRDLGRIFKTEFLLSYLSEPRLRARIRRGLLKVEQLHALARDMYCGRRGRINARELHEQMNSCSCLTLLLACVVYCFMQTGSYKNAEEEVFRMLKRKRLSKETEDD
jgi:TnpA family transposase